MIPIFFLPAMFMKTKRSNGFDLRFKLGLISSVLILTACVVLISNSPKKRTPVLCVKTEQEVSGSCLGYSSLSKPAVITTVPNTNTCCPPEQNAAFLVPPGTKGTYSTGQVKDKPFHPLAAGGHGATQ